MNQRENNDELLSTQRLAHPSPGLRERVLEAANDAWAEAEPARPLARPRSGSESSPWWQFAASAALVLFTGLNVIQSAGNLTAAAQESPAPPAAQIPDSEVKALADEIGLKSSDVKRMAFLSNG